MVQIQSNPNNRGFSYPSPRVASKSKIEGRNEPEEHKLGQGSYFFISLERLFHKWTSNIFIQSLNGHQAVMQSDFAIGHEKNCYSAMHSFLLDTNHNFYSAFCNQPFSISINHNVIFCFI